MENAHPAPGHAALRKGRHSTTGQVYLVSFTTHGRHPTFRAPDPAMAAARAMVDARLWRSAELLAWVLMPDHWHGLIALGEGGALPAVVRRLKANSARRVRADCGGVDRVWATGYHDRALRAEEALVDAARYLVLNPVRAGLVARVGDYPFWDAAWV